jgi:hypothetical protein
MVFSNESSEASSGHRGDVADDDPGKAQALNTLRSTQVRAHANGSAGPALMRSDLSEGPETQESLKARSV